MIWRCQLLCIAAIGAMSAPHAPADEIDDVIKEILAAARTRSEAAGRLLAAAKKLPDSPEAQERLCTQAYEYGILAPSGYPAAMAALDILDRVAPAKSADWAVKRLEVARLRYLRSDRKTRPANGQAYVTLLMAQGETDRKAKRWAEATKHYRQAYSVAKAINLHWKQAIFDKATATAVRAATIERVARLKAAVTKNPNDAEKRRELVLVYLVDLDRPERAAKYLNDTIAAPLRTNAALAAKQAAELADEDFLTLGQWYQKLADGTMLKYAKVQMLSRARDNLKFYLEVHTKADARRLAAKGELAKVAKLLATLAPAKAGPPGELAKGLVLHYTFDTPQPGRVHDSSSKKNHGQASKAIWTRKGHRGGACVFNGGGSVSVPVSPVETKGNWTLAAWVRPDRLKQNGIVIYTRSWGCGFAIAGGGDHTGSRLLGLFESVAWIESGYTFGATGRWVHVVMTRGDETTRFYVNGVQTPRTSSATPAPRTPGKGAAISFGGSRAFHGAVDDVMIWSRELTAPEVKQLYTHTGGKVPGLRPQSVICNR